MNHAITYRGFEIIKVYIKGRPLYQFKHLALNTPFSGGVSSINHLIKEVDMYYTSTASIGLGTSWLGNIDHRSSRYEYKQFYPEMLTSAIYCKDDILIAVL